MKLVIKQAKDVKVGEYLEAGSFGWRKINGIKPVSGPLQFCYEIGNKDYCVQHDPDCFLSIAIPDEQEQKAEDTEHKYTRKEVAKMLCKRCKQGHPVSYDEAHLEYYHTGASFSINDKCYASDWLKATSQHKAKGE